MDFETLIFGDEDPHLIKTQAPVQRPDPIARPARRRVYLEVRVSIGPGGVPVDPESLFEPSAP